MDKLEIKIEMKFIKNKNVTTWKKKKKIEIK